MCLTFSGDTSLLVIKTMPVGLFRKDNSLSRGSSAISIFITFPPCICSVFWCKKKKLDPLQLTNVDHNPQSIPLIKH